MNNIGPSRYFLILSLAFLAGIFLGSFFGIDWLISILAISGLIILSIIFWRDPKVRLISLIAILVLTGISYYHLRAKTADDLIKFHNNEVFIIGQISDEPDVRADQIKLTIQVYQISKNHQNFQNISGKILITSERYPEYQYNQWLKVKGQLKAPKIYPDFDYQQYLAKSDIFSTIYHPEIQEIEKPAEIQQNFLTRSWIWFKKSLLKIKTQFSQKISKILPEPQSSFLAGLLLGEKRAIPENLYQAFVKTGTIHIVVISGFNITIVVKALMGLMRRRSKKLAAILALAGVFLFTILVGAEAPVVRAAIMAGLVIWANLIKRKSDITIALLAAALVMVLANPKVLKLDLGFQLSFLATLGLVYFSPILENWLVRWKNFLPPIIREPLIATLSAQVMVIPIILYNFGRLSLIASLANILIIPIIPLTMFLGFVAVFGGFLWLEIGKILAWLSWLLLTYQIKVAEFLAAAPLAQVEFKISWIWLVILYSIIGYLIWRKSRQLKLKII
jgi:competence protein ComEC